MLQGVGSVLDIAPSPREERLIASPTAAERLRADFDRIGADMRQVFADSTKSKHGYEETP